MDSNKPFACDICGKSFKQKSNMTVHKKIHIGVKPFQCDMCEKTFNQRSNLTQHKRIHTGEKPYECDFCKKTFTQRRGLERHKIIHFSAISNLYYHKLIHTGEKPFECDICDKTFSQRGSLTQHKEFISKSHFDKHKKSVEHLKIIDSHQTHPTSTQTSFVDCSESSMIEDIKKEIKEERNVDDPISIHQESENSYISEDIKKEIKEEKSADILTNQQEIDGIRLYSCDICEEKFTERIVLMMHKDINHSQLTH